MQKKLMYAVKGCYNINDLPVDNLINIEELLFFKRIEPLCTDLEPPIFSAIEIEKIAIEVYREYLNAAACVKFKRNFKLNDYPNLKQKYTYFLHLHKQLPDNTVFNRFLEEEQHINVFVLSLIDKQRWSDELD